MLITVVCALHTISLIPHNNPVGFNCLTFKLWKHKLQKGKATQLVYMTPVITRKDHVYKQNYLFIPLLFNILKQRPFRSFLGCSQPCVSTTSFP